MRQIQDYLLQITLFSKIFAHKLNFNLCNQAPNQNKTGYNTKKERVFSNTLFNSDPGETRTLDPMIKSHLLYQLSYGVIALFANAMQR